MAYFANSTEGMSYETKYCEKCIHYWEEGEGCPVWDAHLLYSYELCNEEDHPGKIILDMLIPMKEDGLFANQCLMFKEKSDS